MFFSSPLSCPTPLETTPLTEALGCPLACPLQRGPRLPSSPRRSNKESSPGRPRGSRRRSTPPSRRVCLVAEARLTRLRVQVSSREYCGVMRGRRAHAVGLLPSPSCFNTSLAKHRPKSKTHTPGVNVVLIAEVAPNWGKPTKTCFQRQFYGFPN